MAPDPGAARARLPLLDRGPRLRPGLPRTRAGPPQPRHRREARRAGRAHHRPPARPFAPALGALPDPRPRGRRSRDAHQDPPCARSTACRAPRSWASSSTSSPRAGISTQEPPVRPDREPSELEMLARGLAGGARAIRCGCCARSPPPCQTSTRRRSGPPGGGRRLTSRRPAAARRRARRRRGPHQPARAQDVFQRPGLGTPPVRLRPALARRGQGDQERVRLHRQRRRRGDLHRRRPPLADRARRAAVRAAGRADPGLGPDERAGGHLRQPDHADERAALHQPPGPGRPPAPNPRGARGDEGASQGAARGAAQGRQPLHPAAVFARAARATFALSTSARGARPGTW